jgi:hypothetical protein
MGLRIVVMGLVFSISLSTVSGQSYVDWNSETWWGLMTSSRVSERWSVYADLHYSHQLFVAPRAGVTYHPKSNNFVTTVAYAYLALATPFSEGKLVRPEHRPWMQTVYRVPSTKRLSASFRFKYDMRFLKEIREGQLGDKFILNNRWRFNNALRYHLNRNRNAGTAFFGVFINEALITTGTGPIPVPYEHRTHLMLDIRKEKMTYSIGGMVRYLGQNTPSSIRMTFGPVIWLTGNFNFSKFKTGDFIDNPEDHTE